MRGFVKMAILGFESGKAKKNNLFGKMVVAECRLIPMGNTAHNSRNEL